MARVVPLKKEDIAGNPDKILDYYLKNTSYYRQTILSAKTALKSVWKKQVEANGAEETKNRLKSFWMSISLVSALLLGVSYQSALVPVTSDDPKFGHAEAVVQIFSGCSLIMSLAVIVISVIYYIEIDNAIVERDLYDFIYNNASMTDALVGLFSGSVITLLVAALATMFITYGQMEFIVVMAFSGFVVLAGAVFSAILAGHNRFRLWVRYESPEGKAHMDNIRSSELTELKDLKNQLDCQVAELRQLKEFRELAELQSQIEKDQARRNAVKLGATIQL